MTAFRDLSFFPFCRELLDRYRRDSRIAYISGANLVEKYLKTNASYFFSQIGGIWGWATSGSEWQGYDRHLKEWPQLRSERMLEEIFDEPEAVAYSTQIFDAMHENRGANTWDYQWLYTCLKNNSLTAVSSVNLIANIGFGQDATHTTTEDARLMLTARSIDPLRHPLSFIPLRSMDRRLQDLRTAPIFHPIGARIRRISNRIIGRGL